MDNIQNTENVDNTVNTETTDNEATDNNVEKRRRVVSIRFRRAGKTYHFDPQEIPLESGDYVVVQTTRGLELGRVAGAPQVMEADESAGPLKQVVRKAEPEDIKRAEEWAAREEEVLEESNQLVTKLRLPMKLLSAEYNLDGSRMTVLFSAAKRVDFRELVRELNNRFRVRVELRQVGPRDETKLVGDFGKCGFPLCCTRFLSEFAPVSIRMAKDQSLSLNPMKISGVCGRLMCCLTYEHEQYRSMRGRMPKQSRSVSTPMGSGVVIGSNLVKETVLVELESKAVVDLPLKDVQVKNGAPKRG